MKERTYGYICLKVLLNNTNINKIIIIHLNKYIKAKDKLNILIL